MPKMIEPAFQRLLGKLAVCTVVMGPLAAKAQTTDPMGSMAASIDQSTSGDYLDAIKDTTRQWEMMRDYKGTSAADKAVYVGKIQHAAQALGAENKVLCDVTNNAASRVHEPLLKLAGCAMGISPDLETVLAQSAQLIQDMGSKREILMTAGKPGLARGEIILQNGYNDRLSSLAMKLQ